LHWPSHSGSALTFVEPMYLPRTARACGPRPPRTNGRTWGRTGRSHGKETAHARTHTRMRVIGTPTRSERRPYPEADATHTGAPARALARASARPHARLGAAPKYMYLNIDGCPCTLYIWLNRWREIHVHPPIPICLVTHTHIDTCVHNVSIQTHMHAYVRTYKYMIDI
jgi:hypothetical protein